EVARRGQGERACGDRTALMIEQRGVVAQDVADLAELHSHFVSAVAYEAQATRSSQAALSPPRAAAKPSRCRMHRTVAEGTAVLPKPSRAPRDRAIADVAGKSGTVRPR